MCARVCLGEWWSGLSSDLFGRDYICQRGPPTHNLISLHFGHDQVSRMSQEVKTGRDLPLVVGFNGVGGMVFGYGSFRPFLKEPHCKD